MEQKTYWWRIVLIAVCMIILTGAYIGPCEYILNRCIWGGDIPVVRSMFHFSVSLLIISGFFSFVRDAVFLSWIRFAFLWCIISLVLILSTPEYSRDALFTELNRESVSIWFSSLFVIVSLVKLVWDTRKPRQNGADSR